MVIKTIYLIIISLMLINLAGATQINSIDGQIETSSLTKVWHADGRTLYRLDITLDTRQYNGASGPVVGANFQITLPEGIDFQYGELSEGSEGFIRNIDYSSSFLTSENNQVTAQSRATCQSYSSTPISRKGKLASYYLVVNESMTPQTIQIPITFQTLELRQDNSPNMPCGFNTAQGVVTSISAKNILVRNSLPPCSTSSIFGNTESCTIIARHSNPDEFI